MTNRRSLKAHEAQVSRQDQFIPGHVGGRVASAQPVRERTKVGAIAAPVVESPPVAPDLFYKTTYGSYSSSGRFAATFDASDYLGSLATSGCPISIVIMSEASVSAPAGWRTLWSHTFDDFNVLVAGIDEYSTESFVFSQDWTGVAGLGEWSYCINIFYPDDTEVGPTGWTWDIKVQNNGESTVGTWASPTDPAWSYSIPMMVTEDCELLNNYTQNSYGGYYIRYGKADVHGWVWFARPEVYGDQFIAAKYAPLALSNGKVWRPDQYYELYTNSEFYGPGPEYNATMCLGLKPS